ncbi:MAG: hypothetical protein F4Z28_04690 [Gammaproteobacteria bacterium]|nr:hypothetical protein [Gammaproteobacteria bacterium]
MGFEAFIPSAPYVGSVLVVGLVLWRVFAKMLGGIEERFQQIDGMFDRIDTRFDKIDERFERVDARFDRADERFDRIEGRLGRIEVSVGSVEARFDGVDRRFGSLEEKVDGLAGDHHRLSRELSEFRGEMHGRLSMPARDTGEA